MCLPTQCCICFQKLILQASCNDVSNAKHIQDVKELFEVGKLSSQNVVEAAKEALKKADKLAAVSDYANDCLFPLVAETADKRIKLGSVNSVPFKSEADKRDLMAIGFICMVERGLQITQTLLLTAFCIDVFHSLTIFHKPKCCMCFIMA